MVLRRTVAGFFGKILKVHLIAMIRFLAKLPGLRGCRPVASAAAILGLSLGQIVLQAEPPQPASVYSRRAGAPASGGAEVVQAAATGEGGAGRGTAEDAAAQAARAERMVASGLATLKQADSFTARVRQKVRVGDRVLVGAGRYVQSGIGEDQRFRFESALKCDTESFELIEVCDGLFSWTYRHYGTEPPQLERLDVRRVREKLVQLRAPDPASASPYLGGVQRSLWMIRQWYGFVSATPSEIGGAPVWVVEGRWRPECLALVLPQLAEAARRPGGITPAELPDTVPWSVRLAFGKNDLVPRRIEWLAIPGMRPVADAPPEPIAVLELDDVRLGGPVDASAFVYKPATDGLIDLTDTYTAVLGLMRP